MQILISNIKMPVKHKIEDVLLAAQTIVRRHCIYARNFTVYKQSVDARRKSDVHYVYSVAAEVDGALKTDGFKDISVLTASGSLDIKKKSISDRPIVVGMGPCGLFAAYVLALSGNPPLIIERGARVEERVKAVNRFWEGGALNPDTNVQFGEGGAGTFSDGKLNTGLKDKRQRFILKTFVKFGAPEDILYRAKPHIGTDELREVLVNMRAELLRLGCEIEFNTRLTGIKIGNGKISEIELNGSRSLMCSHVFLGIGHSSRDTYEMLSRAGVVFEPKPFAAGVRIEHEQSFIGRAQYGEVWHELPAADYKLVYNGKDRSCYSFCMCPGGYVVNASSEEGQLVVNGMSNHDRGGENANSALVVSVRPEDFKGDGPLAGIEFQRMYERLAFTLGGGDYTAPIQLARDFAAGRKSTELGSVTPSYTGKTRLADLNNCLPEFISKTLREGLLSFEHKIGGFLTGDGVLTGIETRTSAPVRILRDESFQAAGVDGLYPIGEGAGYAGGIVSAALDGIKAALAVVDRA